MDVSASGRFHDVQAESTWGTLQGVECLRHNGTVEERDNRADPAAVLVTQTGHLFCFHPRDRDIGIWIMASQRYPQGTVAPPLRALAEGFFQNVRFDAVK